TLYDACANTVLQAMATGLPAIVSSRDGASDFIEDRKTGIRLENPEDREELLARVRQILDSTPEERLRVGANARQRIAHQTWSQHVQDWLELIDRLGSS
ncbi:MAG: UDP-glucose:(heptosyl)LPS alpha-1,3-glucosyltransferase, partial [Verrucomicrobiales bacterium]